MEQQNNHRRLIGWTAFVVLLLLVVAIGDMILGRQTLAPLLQPDPKPNITYYDGTGISIGKWKLHHGKKQSELVGYGIWILDDGGKLPVGYTREWREDGTLSLDVEAFDRQGNATPLYSPDLTDAQLMKLGPIPLIVDRQYAPDGTVTLENRVVDGRAP